MTVCSEVSFSEEQSFCRRRHLDRRGNYKHKQPNKVSKLGRDDGREKVSIARTAKVSETLMNSAKVLEEVEVYLVQLIQAVMHLDLEVSRDF